jgi:hypothetical protein
MLAKRRAHGRFSGAPARSVPMQAASANQCADAYNIQELHMIRKLTLTLALAATFAIGVAGLSSTPATAQGWGWHHHRHFFPGFGARFYGGPAYVYGGPTYAYASCWRPRWVGTRWGTVRKIWVNVCR